jgi:hypothetical protein
MDFQVENFCEDRLGETSFYLIWHWLRYLDGVGLRLGRALTRHCARDQLRQNLSATVATPVGSFEAHIDGNDLAFGPLANLVQVPGNIGKCFAPGNPKGHRAVLERHSHIGRDKTLF